MGSKVYFCCASLRKFILDDHAGPAWLLASGNGRLALKDHVLPLSYHDDAFEDRQSQDIQVTISTNYRAALQFRILWRRQTFKWF